MKKILEKITIKTKKLEIIITIQIYPFAIQKDFLTDDSGDLQIQNGDFQFIDGKTAILQEIQKRLTKDSSILEEKDSFFPIKNLDMNLWDQERKDQFKGEIFKTLSKDTRYHIDNITIKER